MSGQLSFGDFLSRAGSPTAICLGPDARARLSSQIIDGLEALAVPVAPEEVSSTGLPAVFVVTMEDIGALEGSETPARYVLVGQCDQSLRGSTRFGARIVARVLCDDDLGLRRAVDRGLGLVSTELALSRAQEQLELEFANLATVEDKLDETRGRLLHAERLFAVGRFTTGLRRMVRDQEGVFERFESAVRQADIGAELAEFVDQGMKSLRSVGGLLHEITSCSEEEAGDQIVDLDAFADRVVGLTRFDPLRNGRNVVLKLASSAQVRIDTQQIRQALINLMRNAMEATGPGGTITVSTRVVGSEVLIEVADDGCGIPADQIDRIFEPFFTTKGEQGLGLGLGITKETIELHGGKIACQCGPDGGTRFSILLPTAPPGAELVVVAPPESRESETSVPVEVG